MKLYKVLGKGRVPCHGGAGVWPAPTKRGPGRWKYARGPLVLCENGLHLCRAKDLVSWLGPEIWEAEYEGEIVDGGDKVVVRKARLVRKCDRWDERTARLFACDCAEHVLPVFEKQRPGDDRPRKAIETARRYANGKATKKELGAARVAAYDAVRDAGAAALDAGTAAWAAARDAAWAAARDAGAAAEAAARDAEREWRVVRLMEYLDGTAGQGGTK
jgi:hypothetical protein